MCRKKGCNGCHFWQLLNSTAEICVIKGALILRLLNNVTFSLEGLYVLVPSTAAALLVPDLFLMLPLPSQRACQVSWSFTSNLTNKPASKVKLKLHCMFCYMNILTQISHWGFRMAVLTELCCFEQRRKLLFVVGSISPE